MSNEKERLFTEDLFKNIVTQAQMAREKWVNSRGTSEEGFNAGVVQGYWQVLTSLKSRILIYGIESLEHEANNLEPDDIWRKDFPNLET